MPQETNMLVPSSEPVDIVWDQLHAPRAIIGHPERLKGVFGMAK